MVAVEEVAMLAVTEVEVAMVADVEVEEEDFLISSKYLWIRCIFHYYAEGSNLSFNCG